MTKKSRIPASVALVAFTLSTAACGGGNGATSTSSTNSTTTTTVVTTTTTTASTTTTSASTTTTAQEVPLIKVEDGVKTEGLDTLSVRVGETVRFRVEADVADEIHVHGFDLHFDTIPGEEVLVEFVADATGIFEVELEAAELHILDLEVTP
jgi:heme/copper-type cytochrome/quinol oxidase subunit 2